MELLSLNVQEVLAGMVIYTTLVTVYQRQL